MSCFKYDNQFLADQKIFCRVVRLTNVHKEYLVILWVVRVCLQWLYKDVSDWYLATHNTSDTIEHIILNMWLTYRQSIPIHVLNSLENAVECRYNAVQHKLISAYDTTMTEAKHASELYIFSKDERASYGVCFVGIWVKTDRVITAPHCVHLDTRIYSFYPVFLVYKFRLVHVDFFTNETHISECTYSNMFWITSPTID